MWRGPDAAESVQNVVYTQHTLNRSQLALSSLQSGGINMRPEASIAMSEVEGEVTKLP